MYLSSLTPLVVALLPRAPEANKIYRTFHRSRTAWQLYYGVRSSSQPRKDGYDGGKLLIVLEQTSDKSDRGQSSGKSNCNKYFLQRTVGWVKGLLSSRFPRLRGILELKTYGYGIFALGDRWLPTGEQASHRRRNGDTNLWHAEFNDYFSGGLSSLIMTIGETIRKLGDKFITRVMVKFTTDYN